MPPFSDAVRRARPLPGASFGLLVRRWLDRFRDARVAAADDAWARSLLTASEYRLWSRLSVFDRRHCLEAARRLERRLAGTAHAGDPLWPGAALMHDVGKLASNLSAVERALAAVTGTVVRVERARRWADRAGGFRRRIGAYLVHGELGARMIREAGGREAIAAWTEVHQGYGRRDKAPIPPAVVEALLEADFR
jgi:hypothetical protein